MRRPHLGSLATAVWVAVLGFTVGCEPIDPEVDVPPGLSDAVCYRESDCVPNGCCGEGTHPTHISEAPNCTAVRCPGTCPANSIDCGRCIPTCRNSRCEAACQ